MGRQRGPSEDSGECRPGLELDRPATATRKTDTDRRSGPARKHGLVRALVLVLRAGVGWVLLATMTGEEVNGC